jgi:hypothetical protein
MHEGSALMTNAEPNPASPSRPRVPWQQLLLDDIFLLVMAGLVVPTLFYIVWGLMSLGEVPLFHR